MSSIFHGKCSYLLNHLSISLPTLVILGIASTTSVAFYLWATSSSLLYFVLRQSLAVVVQADHELSILLPHLELLILYVPGYWMPDVIPSSYLHKMPVTPALQPPNNPVANSILEWTLHGMPDRFGTVNRWVCNALSVTVGPWWPGARSMGGFSFFLIEKFTEVFLRRFTGW